MKNRHDKMFHYRHLNAFIIAVISLTAFLGCRDNREQIKPVSEKIESSVQIEVDDVKLIDYQPEIDSTCTLVADRRVTFSALVAGNIERLPVNRGDNIKKGDLLFRIRTRDYELSLAQAEANVNRAKAGLNNRSREKERANNLYQAGSITEQQLDHAVFALDEAQASLQQANASRDIARQALNDCEIKAPFNGVVTDRFIEENEYRVPGDPVVELMDLSSLEGHIQIPEKYAGRIVVGQPAILDFDDRFEARESSVESVNPKIDSMTRTFSLKIVLDNPDQLLPSGLFAHVTIKLPVMKSVLAVPSRAVLRDEGKTFVWKIENNTAKKKILQEFGRTEKFVVTRDHLNAGDQVVITGMGGLTDGTDVQITNR